MYHNVNTNPVYRKAVCQRRLTLRKVQRNQRLPRILPITVNSKRNRRRTPQRAPKTNHPEENSRHDPAIPLRRAPPKAHQPDRRRDRDRRRHDEPKLRLIDAAVAPRHEPDDDIADLACDGGAEDAADEGGDVDEAGAERGEVVGRLAAVDGRHGLGEDDEPADAEGVDERAPEDGGVGEEDEWPEGYFEPVVSTETTVPRLQGLEEGLGRLSAEVGCVALGAGGKRRRFLAEACCGAGDRRCRRWCSHGARCGGNGCRLYMFVLEVVRVRLFHAEVEG